MRGFGKALDWGTHLEEGMAGVVQSFERGTMLYSPAINGHARRIYVLLADGSYATYDDAQ